MSTTTSGSSSTPRAALSVFDAVMIVTGIVIGGGIFAFPPLVAGIAGSPEWTVIAWVLGGVLSLIGALVYAEMSTTFPNAGGDYHFLVRAFGRDVGFFFGWARVMVITTGAIALLAFVFGDYLTAILPLGKFSSAIYGAFTVVVLTAVNVAGLRESARTQNVLTALEVLGLLLIVVAGAVASGNAPAVTMSGSALSAVPPALGTALLFVLFTFGGWNEAAYISAEIKGGNKAILRALVYSLLLITGVYLMVVFALLYGLGYEDLAKSKAVGADVMRVAFGNAGAALISGVVAIATLTSINATMIVGARTNYALGRDWPIVSFMSRWNVERDAPVRAYLVQGGLALVLVLLGAVEKQGVKTMVDFTAPVFWFFIMLTGIALFVLRFRFPHVARPFSVPLYPILPIIFVGTAGFLFYRSVSFAFEMKAVQVALYVMLAGFVAWIIARLKKG